MGNLKIKMFKVSTKINTFLLIALILTLTSITTKTNSLRKWNHRIVDSNENLPYYVENNQNSACRIKLFDNDYAFRTHNRMGSCDLPEWTVENYQISQNGFVSYGPKIFQTSNLKSPKTKTRTVKRCEAESSLPWDLIDDLKSVTSLDCECFIHIISDERKKGRKCWGSKLQGTRYCIPDYIYGKESLTKRITLKKGESVSLLGKKANKFTMDCRLDKD